MATLVRNALNVSSAQPGTLVLAFICCLIFPMSVLGEDEIQFFDPNEIPLASEFTVDISACKLENDTAPGNLYNPDLWDPPGSTDGLKCKDSAYVQGNLGSLYNELDLVPHRIIIDAKNAGVIPATYQLVVGADNLISTSPLIIGYDQALFDSATGCDITFLGPIQVGDFGIGGAAQQAIQVIEVEQTEDICEIDFVLRLAITSHLITGSSNRSFVYAGGAESLPIPNVEDPFLFTKTMTGTLGSVYDWILTKGADPANVDFGNTCEMNPATDYAEVDITVEWTRSDPVPSGNVSIATIITLDNPSLRTLKFDLEDQIFNGLVSLEGPTQINDINADCGDAVFEGDLLVVEPTEVVECAVSWTEYPYADGMALNDIATGDIHDPIIGDVLPLGETTADAVIQNTGDSTNDTADIVDSEWISGDNFEFEVVAVSAGTAVPMNTLIGEATDPNSVEWSINGVSGNGSATFSKRIYFKAPKASAGSLRDTATLTASDGLIRVAPAGEDYLAVDLTTDPLVDLTISKTIPFALTAGDPGDPNQIVFDFDVTGPDAYASNHQITFTKPAVGDSDTTLTVTIQNLAPGTYTVTENAPIGWTPTDPVSGTRQVEMTADTYDDCAGTAYFDNEPSGELVARAIKVTVPEALDGSSLAAGWTMTLDGPGTPVGGESKVTACAGVPEECGVEFDTDLQLGAYTITETGMAGWDGVSSGQCSFNVTLLDLIFGKTFTCTWTNTQRGSVIIDKDTLPTPYDMDFAFSEDISEGGVGFSLNTSGTDTKTFNNVLPGSYGVTETDPSPACTLNDNPCSEAWDLVSLNCDDDYDSNGYDVVPSSPLSDAVDHSASIGLDPGETVYCLFTNQLRGQVEVTKTEGGVPAGGYQFDIREGSTVIATDTSELDGTVDFGGEYFLPGNYALCEQEVDAGWLSSLESDPSVFYPLPGDNSYVCVPFTLVAGETEQFQVENTPPPGGNARTIGYWRNWSGDCSNGNQEDKLGDALALGVTLGEMVWPDDYTTCDAVQIISKRNLAGENRAFDPAYALASQFFAYLLNVNAGADACGLGSQAADAQALLDGVDFDGTDPASGNKKKDSAYVANKDKGPWMQLASLFDAYNNNELSCPYSP